MEVYNKYIYIIYLYTVLYCLVNTRGSMYPFGRHNECPHTGIKSSINSFWL